MTFVVSNQPRTPGSELARLHIFGEDSSTPSPLAQFRGAVTVVADHVTVHLEAATCQVEAVAAGRGVDAKTTGLRTAHEALVDASRRVAARNIDRPFRIVLMGRTMAGKSTLFEYLSRGTGARIGVGAQRTTRDTSVKNVFDMQGVEIVDTPGVGAMDGEDDYEAAFAQVADADLILWVATDQATQEQTARALRRLADLGKPVMVALNCLADIQDEINYFDLLDEPERIFGGDAETNLAPIRRHLATAGGHYLDAYLIHAQAAHLASSGAIRTNDAPVLLERSRINALLEGLVRQRDQTATVRRYVSISDSVKFALLEASQAVDGSRTQLARILASAGGSREAFERRARRRIADADQELKAAFTSALAARERWVEQVDVDMSDKEVNRAWSSELGTLGEELNASAVAIASRLEADLKVIALEVSEDWSAFSTDRFRDLGSLGAIWGNRAVKVGGRVGSALSGLWAGAAIGTGIAGPAGTAFGGAVGLVIGLVGSKLSDWLADRVFRSPTQLRQRRRQALHDQLTSILGDLAGKIDATRAIELESWLQRIETECNTLRGEEAAVSSLLEGLESFARDVLEPAVVEIDTELARELFRVHGRDRTAAAVVRATRWRGGGAAVELPGPGFTETALFPLPDHVERLVPTTTGKTPAAGALQIIRNLADGPITVRQMTDGHLVVALATPSSPGVREAWEALARVHTGASVHIEGSVQGGL